MSQFHFKNFEPSFEFRFHANMCLNKILDTAPYGATGMGLIEKKGDKEYLCMLDIYSPQGPFMASVVRSTPEQALNVLEEKMKKQIQGWRSQKPERSISERIGLHGRSILTAS